MTNKETFLGSLKIFSELRGEGLDEELVALARQTEEYVYEAGSIVAYQRDLADRLYMVRSGRLFAFQLDQNGIVRQTRSYREQDCFNDLWLFSPQTHPFTIRAAEESSILVLSQEKFQEYLSEYPYVLDYLDLSEEAWDAVERGAVSMPSKRSKSLNLLADEMVEFHVRRSLWLLVIKIFFPVLLILLLGGLIALRANTMSAVVVVLAGLVSFLLALFVVIQTIDWANDYFIITNKHLIHHEMNLLRLKAHVAKTPIDQVQSVEVLKPGLLAVLTNTGSARVTTAAQSGAISFDFIDDPQNVADVINSFREQARVLDAGRIQTSMRSSLERHFETNPGYHRVEADLEEERENKPLTNRNPLLGILSRARRGVGARVVEGDVITYRKHIFTFLGRARLPVFVAVLLLAGLIFSPWLEVAVVLTILFLIALVWLLWRFEDWRNDTFQLSDRYVIDIDRRPFGFGESRKQAELGNVQNVNANKTSVWATLFNFGDVIIETAGADADLTFERVTNPTQVQSDIFERREAYMKQRSVREGEERRKEFAVMLDVFQQAQEQNRLPRRTPPPLSQDG